MFTTFNGTVFTCEIYLLSFILYGLCFFGVCMCNMGYVPAIKNKKAVL